MGENGESGENKERALVSVAGIARVMLTPHYV
jgi:hypothetical protein